MKPNTLNKNQAVANLCYEDGRTEIVSKDKLWKILRQSIIAHNFMNSSKVKHSRLQTSGSQLIQSSNTSNLSHMGNHVLLMIQAHIVPNQASTALCFNYKGHSKTVEENYLHWLTYTSQGIVKWQSIDEFTSELYLQNGLRVQSTLKENQICKATTEVLECIEECIGSRVKSIQLSYIKDVNSNPISNP